MNPPPLASQCVCLFVSDSSDSSMLDLWSKSCLLPKLLNQFRWLQCPIGWHPLLLTLINFLHTDGGSAPHYPNAPPSFSISLHHCMTSPLPLSGCNQVIPLLPCFSTSSISFVVEGAFCGSAIDCSSSSLLQTTAVQNPQRGPEPQHVCCWMHRSGGQNYRGGL